MELGEVWKARVKELGLDGSFVFTGPLDDEAKWEAYRRADVFVLPTYSVDGRWRVIMRTNIMFFDIIFACGL